MAEQLTVKVPELDNSGLTDEAKKELTRFLRDIKEQYNKDIADLERRLKALE